MSLLRKYHVLHINPYKINSLRHQSLPADRYAAGIHLLHIVLHIDSMIIMHTMEEKRDAYCESLC